jgi:hypothetical protein
MPIARASIEFRDLHDSFADLAQKMIGYDPHLDFRGALEDLSQARVAPVTFGGKQRRVSGTAMNLQAFASHALSHLTSEKLDHCGFLVAAAATIDLGAKRNTLTLKAMLSPRPLHRQIGLRLVHACHDG